jgi:hypothetical protein
MRSLWLIALGFTLTACGSSGDGGYGGGDNKPAPPPADDPEFAKVQPLIEKNCGKCHNGTTHPVKFDTAAKFNAGKAKARLTAGTMPPPPATISADDKQALLAYLK